MHFFGPRPLLIGRSFGQATRMLIRFWRTSTTGQPTRFTAAGAMGHARAELGTNLGRGDVPLFMDGEMVIGHREPAYIIWRFRP